MPIEFMTQALRLLNNLIEGEPMELRQAKASLWFWATWPLAKRILALNKTPKDVVDQIEDLAKSATEVKAP